MALGEVNYSSSVLNPAASAALTILRYLGQLLLLLGDLWTWQLNPEVCFPKKILQLTTLKQVLQKGAVISGTGSAVGYPI